MSEKEKPAPTVPKYLAGLLIATLIISLVVLGVVALTIRKMGTIVTTTEETAKTITEAVKGVTEAVRGVGETVKALGATLEKVGAATKELREAISALESRVRALEERVARPPAPRPLVTLDIEYGQPWEDMVAWALAEFEKIRPSLEDKYGVRITVKLAMIPYGVDIVAKESADFKAGTAGDVVIYDSFMTAEYAAAGYLEDITDLVRAWPDWAKFSEPMRKITTFKGRVYGVMVDTDVRMIWYRKDIFKLAGLPEEWQPKTWDDIFAAIEKLLAAKDKIMKELGLKEFYPFYIPAGTKWGEATTMQGFYMVLLGADKPPYNRLYDYKTGKWIGKSTALYRAFWFYYKVYVELKAGPVEYNFAPDPWYTHRKTFAEGKVAMDVGGSWEWNEGWHPKYGIAPIPNRDEVVGFAKMPGIKGGAEGELPFVTISGGWAVGINAKSTDIEKKLAWEFIKILCSKEIEARYAAKYGKVCPRLDAVEVEEYRKDPYLSKLVEYLKFTDFRDALPGYSRVSYFVQKVTEDIITKGITPDEALEEFYSLLVKEFGKDKVEVLPVRK